MRIISKVRHTELDPETKAYAEGKVRSKCAHYLDENDSSIRIEIEFDDQFGSKGGQDKRVDITITLPREHLPIHIEETDTSFKTAINRAVDRLDPPLSKYKETTR